MLMYLWTILHKNDSELVRKVFDTQKQFPVKNDWVLQVEEDMHKCKLELTEEDIASMNLSEEYLKKQIAKHSKTDKLYPSDKMQNYLINLNMTVEEKKLLFLLRSRMYSVKKNFQNGISDIQCTLCSKSEEDQQHLLVCEEIVKEEELKNVLVKSKISYEDIFGPPNKQTVAVKVWRVIDKIWKRKIKEKNAD